MNKTFSFTNIDLVRMVRLYSHAGLVNSKIAIDYFFTNSDDYAERDSYQRMPDPCYNFTLAVKLASNLEEGKVTLVDGIFYKTTEYYPESEGL